MVRFFISLLLLLVCVGTDECAAGIIVDVRCPHVCMCSAMPMTADCSGKELDALPENLGREVRSLDLSRNDFTGVPHNLSAFVQLQRLDLSRNRINALHANDLRDLHQLQYLDVSRNHFAKYSDIHAQVLLGAPALLHFDLSHNTLRSFPDSASASLRTLDLSNCSISKLETRMMDAWPELRWLNLSANKLKAYGVLLRSTTLEVLNLSECLLQTLNINVLDYLPALSHLHLARNYQLKSYGANSSSLVHLDLSDCNLESVPKCALPALTHLNLTGNHVRRLDAAVFRNMPAVREVQLAYNSIEHVDGDAFKEAEALETLDLHHNTIGSMDRYIFNANRKLSRLRLSKNYFTGIVPLRAGQLISLDMSDCEIAEIRTGDLLGMPRLVELILAGNTFTSLPLDFTSKSLQKLDVANCRLTSLRNASFANAPNVYQLNIAGNRLVEFHFQNFRNITHIYLGDNPWRCDCESKLFEASYRTLSNVHSDVAYARCQTPDRVEGRTWYDACSQQWYGVELTDTDQAWIISLCVLVICSVGFCGYITYSRERKRRRAAISRQRQEASMRLITIVERQAAERQQQQEQQRAFENAPDAREAERPPSYHEAIAMPPLGSTMSLKAEGSVASSLNHAGENVVKPQRTRRKRRKKSPHRSTTQMNREDPSDPSSTTPLKQRSRSNPDLLESDDKRGRRRRRRSATRSQACGEDSSSSIVETDV